jgi:hypothetical protein
MISMTVCKTEVFKGFRRLYNDILSHTYYERPKANEVYQCPALERFSHGGTPVSFGNFVKTNKIYELTDVLSNIRTWYFQTLLLCFTMYRTELLNIIHKNTHGNYLNYLTYDLYSQKFNMLERGSTVSG